MFESLELKNGSFCSLLNDYFQHDQLTDHITPNNSF